MGSFATHLFDVANSVRTSYFNRRAAQQGGLLNGADPSAYNPHDPIRIWIIQLSVIILMTQLLSLLLVKVRQPRVISEVLGGIILGPTAFGRIPGFTHHIFPEESRPFLSLVAAIGLVLFLFLVGLEIDGRIIKRNLKPSVLISLGGMSLPFGLGAALSVPIYNRFVDENIKFTHFMLFVGVAFSITAFPVLCRILTELKLLDTTVGIVVLSAGVGNDIVGWVLLALSVALVNASTGLTALWILLAAIGWTIFILFPGKWALRWLANWTGSIENKAPTPLFMTATMLMVFGSAFFTDIIGVHAIFGAFVVGIVVPREGGLAIHITEKLEDMVSIIFLPLYFTLSGLSTDLGTLNDGITWGFTIAICCVAYLGKFCGGTVAARTCGFQWREACAIGTLMSCKGLVELIVLNVGLSAGILNVRVFSMFVIEALVLTFMTTPVVLYLYPPHLRIRASATGANFSGVEGAPEHRSKPESLPRPSEDGSLKTRFSVVLDKEEHLPVIMRATYLLRPATNANTNTERPHSPLYYASNVVMDAVRLIELSNRTSAVMKSSVADDLLHTDPLLSVYRTFGELNDLPVSASLSVVIHESFAPTVVEHIEENGSELLVIPWVPSISQVKTGEHPPTPGPSTSTNPFDALFRGGASTTTEKNSTSIQTHFIRSTFAQSPVDVALFVDRGPSQLRSIGQTRHHFVFPFFGGPDDRAALALLVQMCVNPRATATVIKVVKTEAPVVASREAKASVEEQEQQEALARALRENNLTVHSVTGQFPDTIYGQPTTQTRIESETADQVLWARYTTQTTPPPPAAVVEALSRVTFTDISSPTPVHSIIQHVATERENTLVKRQRLSIMVGRGRRLAVESHHAELDEIMTEYSVQGSFAAELKRTVGEVGAACLVAVEAGLVVVQGGGATVQT